MYWICIREKTKVNKAFPYLVEDLMQEEYKPFETTILSKNYLYSNRLDDMSYKMNGYLLLKRECYHLMEEENINKIKTGIDNNKELVEKISKKIVVDIE